MVKMKWKIFSVKYNYFVIKFDDVKELVKEDNGSIVGYIDNIGQYQVEYPNSTEKDLKEKMDKLKSQDIVKENSVNLNEALEVESNDEPSFETFVEEFKPNDPWYNSEMGWDEAHPSNSKWGFEAIRALSSRRYRHKMVPVSVGVLEVGKFFNSEDINFEEFSANNDKASNSNYHADHVSGIIAATSDNRKGISGVAPNAKMYGYAGNIYNSELVKSLTKAISVDKVKVLNYSAGYASQANIDDSSVDSRKQEAREVLDLLKSLREGEYDGIKHDFVIAASAGNFRNKSEPVASAKGNSVFTYAKDIDDAKYNDVKNRIIIVGAIQLDNKGYSLSSYTQLGKAVDVVAPGSHIYSTLYDNKYGFKSGTSMAAPQVAGVASILWGLQPDLTGAEIKNYIVSTADRNVAYNLAPGVELDNSDYKDSYPIVNAFNAIGKLVRNQRIKAVDGWVDCDGKSYFYNAGSCIVGWARIDGLKYYLDSEDGGAKATGVRDIDGTVYDFGEEGFLY